MKFPFYIECSIYVVGFFRTKPTLEKSGEPADLRAIISERILLGRHIPGDLFQQGPQTVDLREPVCRIMSARGSGVMQTYFFHLSKTRSYPETGI